MSYKHSHTGKDFAEHYDANIGSKFESRIYDIEKEVLAEMLEQFFQDHSISVMDFASGTGRMTSFIGEKYPNIVGYDISDDMIEVAKKKFRDIAFYKRDIAEENISERFDLITAFRFFLNAEAPLKKLIFEKLNGLLKNEGYLLFNIHMNSCSLLFFMSRLKYLLGLSKIKQNGMSQSDVKEYIESSGYHMVHSR
jgi:predicted TPR repeat methyltransferase